MQFFFAAIVVNTIINEHRRTNQDMLECLLPRSVTLSAGLSARKLSPSPGIFLWPLCSLCSFQLTGRGEKYLPWGQNSRHSYPLTTAPLCQQVILTPPPSSEGGTDIFKMVCGKQKQANQYIKKITTFLLSLKNSGVFPRRNVSHMVQLPEAITLENEASRCKGK